MVELLKVVFTPQFLAAIGPFGIFFLLSLYALYKLFKRYDDIQEKRVQETKAMQQEYMELAKEIDKTLDILVNIATKSKGNGNG
jgi:hypothetical protein